MLTAQFLFFLAISAALTARHRFPPFWFDLFPAIAAVSSRNSRMVDPHVLDGQLQPALCQLVGLIDDFCAHAAPPSTRLNSITQTQGLASQFSAP